MEEKIRFLLFSILVLTVTSCSGHKPMQVAYSPSTQPKHIVVCLDGTSNDWQTRTNVRRLFEIIADQDRRDIVAYYDEGVGNSLFVTGNALGAGFGKNVRQAYRFIAKQYNPGDKIYLFGFSRGAAEARSLSGMIKYIGLLKKDIFDKKNETNTESDSYEPVKIITDEESWKDPVHEAYKVYKKNLSEKEFAKELAALHKRYDFHPDVKISVVGVWDTVASLGISIFQRVLTNESTLVEGHHRLELHDNIENAYHALSIDEQRKLFKPVLWNPKEKRDGQVLEQVWFPGVHSDVGGGYGDSKELAGLSLNWMLTKLKKEGLLPTGYRVHASVVGQSHDSFKKIFRFWNRLVRTELKCASENRISIHRSVIKRIEANIGYSPEQIIKCGQFNKELSEYGLKKCFNIVDEGFESPGEVKPL
jgi:uncharacterized protein (DUF2235 family)